jgi:hypothetical protein
MRTLDVIDAELRLLVMIRSAAREAGGQPSTAAVDELLDERLSARPDQCAPCSVLSGDPSSV